MGAQLWDLFNSAHLLWELRHQTNIHTSTQPHRGSLFAHFLCLLLLPKFTHLHTVLLCLSFLLLCPFFLSIFCPAFILNQSIYSTLDVT